MTIINIWRFACVHLIETNTFRFFLSTIIWATASPVAQISPVCTIWEPQGYCSTNFVYRLHALDIWKLTQLSLPFTPVAIYSKLASFSVLKPINDSICYGLEQTRWWMRNSLSSQKLDKLALALIPVFSHFKSFHNLLSVYLLYVLV